MTGFEPVTSSLPRKRSTPELHRRKVLSSFSNKKLTNKYLFFFERETGFEPATFSLEG